MFSGPLADKVQPTDDPSLPGGLGIETVVAAPAQD